MARKKRPPIKLEWLDAVWPWIRHTNLPVSKAVGYAVAATAMRTAASDGKGVLLSASFIARETGLNKTRDVNPMLGLLVDNGWLFDTGATFRKSTYYDLTIGDNAVPDNDPRNRDNAVPDDETVSGTVSGTTSGTTSYNTSVSDLEGGEGGAGSADATPAPTDDDKKLVIEWMDRWQYIARKFDLISDELDIHNRDLVAEFRRLSQWNKWDLVDAIPNPRQIKSSTTGWLLSRLEKLPADPLDNLKVAERRIGVWIEMIEDTPEFTSAATRAEKAAAIGYDLDEYETVVQLAKRHGYINDDGWTQKGRNAIAKARKENNQ